MECFVTLFNGVQGLTFSELDLYVAAVVVIAAAAVVVIAAAAVVALDEVEVDGWKGLKNAFWGSEELFIKVNEA